MSVRSPAAFIGLAPVLVAVAFVLIGFVNNAVPLDQLWRPMAIAVAAALAIQAVAVLRARLGPGSFWAFVAVGVSGGALRRWPARRCWR